MISKYSDERAMYTDIFGTLRIRLGLHHHSTFSDGRSTPEQIAALYQKAGYDAIAITDHWTFEYPG